MNRATLALVSITASFLVVSVAAAAAYLVAFGLGTIAAMGTFSSILGWASAGRG